MASTVRQFFGCYLLQSSLKANATYIGFTCNPARRIRQHNGEIANGARLTRRFRPWQMTLCVWGFPSQISALQFEWTWQHPHLSRISREAVAAISESTPSSRGGAKRRTPRRRPAAVVGNLKVLCALLSCKPYSGMPLNVHFLEREVFSIFAEEVEERCMIPHHMPAKLGSFEELPVSKKLCETSLSQTDDPTPQLKQSICPECVECFQDQAKLVRCSDCEHAFHVTCAAECFLRSTTRESLIPRTGRCPLCGAELSWPLLAGAVEVHEGSTAVEDDGAEWLLDEVTQTYVDPTEDWDNGAHEDVGTLPTLLEADEEDSQETTCHLPDTPQGVGTSSPCSREESPLRSPRPTDAEERGGEWSPGAAGVC